MYRIVNVESMTLMVGPSAKAERGTRHIGKIWPNTRLAGRVTQCGINLGVLSFPTIAR
jgi:hypothetical protein